MITDLLKSNCIAMNYDIFFSDYYNITIIGLM